VWIAIDALLDALSGSQPPRSIDLFALVCRMREARQGMLQTKEQYAYVLHFLATCMHKRRFGVANHGN
jgi:protein tyrosine phosphatase